MVLFGASSSHIGDIGQPPQMPCLRRCIETIIGFSSPRSAYWPQLTNPSILLSWCSPIIVKSFCEHRHSSFVPHVQPLTYSSHHQNASTVPLYCYSIIPWSSAGDSNRRVEKNSIPVEIPLPTNQQLARRRLFSLFLSIMKPLHASTMNLINS